MKWRWILSLAVAAGLITGLVIIKLPLPRPPPQTPAAPAVSVSAAPGGTVAVTHSPEEVFQRAFWRHPAAADRIVHADRREWTDQNRNVQRWQWFLQVEPSAGLLRALRNSDTFGLIRTTAPRPPAESTSFPAWFPSARQLAECEILQSFSGELTVYYRAAGNVLFATDSGRGFAPPAIPIASR